MPLSTGRDRLNKWKNNKKQQEKYGHVLDHTIKKYDFAENKNNFFLMITILQVLERWQFETSFFDVALYFYTKDVLNPLNTRPPDLLRVVRSAGQL